MKIKFHFLLFGLLLFAVGCENDPVLDTQLSSNPVLEEAFLDGELCIKFDRETADDLSITRTRSGEVLTGNLSFDEICRHYEVTSMERLFPDNGCAERTRKAGLDRWYVVRFKGASQQVQDAFLQQIGVQHVEVPGYIEPVDPMLPAGFQTPMSTRSSRTHAVPENYPFNDPLFGGQWNLYNDGTVNKQAVAGADANVLGAWKKTAGRPDVIVAVLDEAVQYNHPDLEANMWEGIGKNFCSDGDKLSWSGGEGHGTHVAGTIAAVNNNGIGISSIAGGTGNGDGVRIMSCQLFHPTNSRYNAATSGSAAAIKYAADHGAVICQNSWGSSYKAYASEEAWLAKNLAVKEAIDYFVAYAGMSPDGETQVGPMAGGIVLFSAGNENTYMKVYPSSYEPCISVSSITCAYMASWYSNYGYFVDIAAPGGGEWSVRLRMKYDEGYQLSTLPTDYSKDLETVAETGYGYKAGTSMACPHVSAIAALIVSYFGQPGFTNDQLKEILFSTTRDIDEYQSAALIGSNFQPGMLGRLVDATAALNYDAPVAQVMPTITPEQEMGSLRLHRYERIELHFTLDNYTEWALEDPSGKIESSIADDVVTLTIDGAQFEPGDHSASLKASNELMAIKYPIHFTIEKQQNNDAMAVLTASLYPNPCAGDTLQILIDRTGQGEVCFYTATGNEVLREVREFVAGEPQPFDLSGLNSGSYRVEIRCNRAIGRATLLKK